MSRVVTDPETIKDLRSIKAPKGRHQRGPSSDTVALLEGGTIFLPGNEGRNGRWYATAKANGKRLRSVTRDGGTYYWMEDL